MKFVSHDGLLYFWTKVKSYINNKTENIGQTIYQFGEIGETGKTKINATVIMQKLSSTTCNLTIRARITERDENASSTEFKMIDVKKVKALLGITLLQWDGFNTDVTLQNIATEDLSTMHYGSDGLKFEYHEYEDSSIRGLLGRRYTDDGKLGVWELTNTLFTPNTYYIIHIYGATYAA